MFEHKTFLERNKIEICLIGFLVIFVCFWIMNYSNKQTSEYQKAVERQKYNDQIALQRHGNSDPMYAGGYQTPTYTYFLALIILVLMGYVFYKSRTLATGVFLCGFGLLMISFIFDAPPGSPASRQGSFFLGFSRMFGFITMIAGFIFFMRQHMNKPELTAATASGATDLRRTPLTNLNRCPNCSMINSSDKTVCFRCSTAL